jgi:hypothetical protein
VVTFPVSEPSTSMGKVTTVCRVLVCVGKLSRLVITGTASSLPKYDEATIIEKRLHTVHVLRKITSCILRFATFASFKDIFQVVINSYKQSTNRWSTNKTIQIQIYYVLLNVTFLSCLCLVSLCLDPCLSTLTIEPRPLSLDH